MFSTLEILNMMLQLEEGTYGKAQKLDPLHLHGGLGIFFQKG